MWVKICGIRDVQTARGVAALRPDAIGLNFYAKSPRVVDARTAAEIVRDLPDGVEPVGLFVNHTVDEVVALCTEVGLRSAQLHGDETPRQVAELQHRLPSVKIIRALRVGPDGIESIKNYLSECERLGVKLAACLVDALVDGVYGGSGKTVAWDAIAASHRGPDWPPLVLAGGLNPQNVAQAIAAVAPWGVDVASGVETSPGKKDLAAVKSFIENSRDAG